MDIIFASHNAHKREEVKRIMGHILPAVMIHPPKGKPPVEDGLSFVDNALIKAWAAAKDPDLVVVADDSGIVVEALGGEPGINSARYSGTGDDTANLELLLQNLGDSDNRAAQFVCAAAVLVGGEEYVIERSWSGTIAREPYGDGGFGYDPIFIPTGFDMTAAELSPREKDLLSHRGQAFRQVAMLLSKKLSD
jgi:XTP/dITP diphosphohydrolase